MVQLWRKEWGLGELPFYFAEIAPYAYGALSKRKLPTCAKRNFVPKARFRTVP